jgi:hypothetical protein
MKRRILSCLLAAAVTLGLAAVPTRAVSYGDVAGVPKNFWAVYTPYEDALSSGSSSAIALAGENVMNYWLDGKAAKQLAQEWKSDIAAHGYEVNLMHSVSKKVAEEYEKLGDFSNAARVYEITLAFVDPYIALIRAGVGLSGNADDMEFERAELQNKINAYDVQISVYAQLRESSDGRTYHSAKHEPRAGVYFGEPSGNMVTEANPGSTVIYVDFENENMEARVEHDLTANEPNGYKRDDYSVIEIAWNFAQEGSTLSSVPSQADKVTAAARYLNSLGLPILLRVGAEMDVWETKADPEQYKTAFRFIADIMRREAPNVAIVWSVNSVSAQGLSWDMFYPGDSYVDWVGISLYTTKYFRGKPDTKDSEAAIYGTGKYANPVAAIQKLAEQYGARKPLMISEGGVSLLNISNSEDLTEWALPRMRQTYAYIPILFPQVKAIYWFNTQAGSENRYDFAASPQAKALYIKLTSQENFLGKGKTLSPVTYKKLGSVTLPANNVTLTTYAPFFTMDNISVQYRLDGAWLSERTDIPYLSSLDLTSASDGAHTLTVEVRSGGELLKTETYAVQKSGDNVTIVKE